MEHAPSKAPAPKQSPILKRQTVWENLWFYQKAKALYGITFHFAHRFLSRGDRTIDQMIQAARSGKQNIVEGSADGMTSTEMELKLLNVARASLKELREDYEDYLMARGLSQWDFHHPRYDRLLKFCRTRNRAEDYGEALLVTLSDEKIANLAITLCHIVDRMMVSYLGALQRRFTEEGGIRERMTAARLGYRNAQKEIIAALQRDIAQLKEENRQLRNKLAALSDRET